MENLPIYMEKIIIPAFFDTCKMVIISMVLATILGFALAIIIHVTDKKGLFPLPAVNLVLNFLINTIRSFPLIILMVTVLPLTRLLVGSSVGVRGAIVPLTLSSAPFIARIIDNAMKEVDPQLVEAAKSLGASNWQVITKVVLVEAVPAIVSGLLLAMISVLGGTAMAGAIGAGGLGGVALSYGYQNYNTAVMVVTVVILIVMVQIIQFIGDRVYNHLKW